VIEPVTLEANLGPGQLPPYGEVLRGVFEGDPTLSVRGDTAVECWRIVEPVLEAWREDEVRLQEYTVGTTGPEEWPVPQRPQR
jgi:glucose-6-phosphate 1-dehydrogenase